MEVKKKKKTSVMLQILVLQGCYFVSLCKYRQMFRWIIVPQAVQEKLNMKVKAM
jgi:hypothetical protein